MGFAEGFGKEFGKAFSSGFDRTFKTKEEKEAAKKEAELKQLQIDEKKLDLNMKKTTQMHQKAVEEVVTSGFDPNTVANVMSDYHPNKHQYKFAGQDANGGYKFQVGQYEKNEDGTYKRDPETGTKIFHQAKNEDGSRVEQTFDKENYKKEVGMRLQPQAWFGSYLKDVQALEQRRFELTKVEKQGEETRKTQGEGFEGKGKLQDDQQGFQKTENEKDRQLKRDLADKELEGTKYKADRTKAASEKEPYTSFEFPGSKKPVPVNKGDFEKLKSHTDKINKTLGGDVLATEKDAYIIEKLRSNKDFNARVDAARNTGKGADQIKAVLKKYGMDEMLADEIVNKMAAPGDREKKGGAWNWLFGPSGS